MAQRRTARGLLDTLRQRLFEKGQELGIDAGFHIETNYAGILADRAIEGESLLHVIEHGIVDYALETRRGVSPEFG